MSREIVQTKTIVRVTQKCGHQAQVEDSLADVYEQLDCFDCEREGKTRRIDEARERYEAWVALLSPKERMAEAERFDEEVRDHARWDY